MALVRHYKPSVRLEYEEMDGLINVYDQTLEADEFTSDTEKAAYIGALVALKIIRHHEHVEYPHEVMSLFAHYLETPNREGVEDAI